MVKISLFDQDSKLTASSIYIAYQILKIHGARNPSRVRETRTVDVIKLMHAIKKTNPSCNPKQFVFALMFLHITGIISFENPNIIFDKVDA